MTGEREEMEAVDLIMEGGSWVLISFFWIDSAKWYNLTTDKLSFSFHIVKFVLVCRLFGLTQFKSDSL